MILAAWLTEVGIIGARDLARNKRPPLPSELLATFVVFGALAGVGAVAPKPAALAGWGIVVATLLSSKVDVLGPIGDFMTGTKTPAAPTTGPGSKDASGVPYYLQPNPQ